MSHLEGIKYRKQVKYTGCVQIQERSGILLGGDHCNQDIMRRRSDTSKAVMKTSAGLLDTQNLLFTI